jgi:hypothetical protein
MVAYCPYKIDSDNDNDNNNNNRRKKWKRSNQALEVPHGMVANARATNKA